LNHLNDFCSWPVPVRDGTAARGTNRMRRDRVTSFIRRTTLTTAPLRWVRSDKVETRPPGCRPKKAKRVTRTRSRSSLRRRRPLDPSVRAVINNATADEYPVSAFPLMCSRQLRCARRPGGPTGALCPALFRRRFHRRHVRRSRRVPRTSSAVYKRRRPATVTSIQ